MPKQLTHLLTVGVQIFLLLTCMFFFLLENGKAHSFALYLLALASLTLLAINFSKLRLLTPAAGTAVAVFIVYMMASSFWSDIDQGSKYIGYTLLLLLFLISIPVSLAQHARFMTWLVSAIIMAATVNAAYSVHLHFLLPEYPPLPEPRLYAMGRLSNPVIGALSYGLASVMCIHRLLTVRSNLLRGGLIVCLAILLWAIVLTGSRAVWLAIGAALAAGLFLRFNHHSLSRRLAWIGVSLAGLTLLVGGTLGFELIWARALSFRPEIWGEFISRTIEGNALFGVGLGTSTLFQLPELLIKHPHSLFVSTFHYGGVVGLALYCAMLTAVISAASELQDSEQRHLTLMLLAFGITATFFDGNEAVSKIDHLWLIIWLPVGLALSAGGVVPNQPIGHDEVDHAETHEGRV